MHYKFIRKSLSLFNESIHKIEQGNLDERVQIPESHELGDLAKSFNERSEEHTSELQSHSFISYAVFCLKKKKTKE